MISETASEEISRTDELPAGSTLRSRKRIETEVSEEGEEIDHIARIFEFFSRDSVIRTVLLVQTTIAILSYGFLNFIFQPVSQFYQGSHLTFPFMIKLLLSIFPTENFFVFLDYYSISSDTQYILHFAAIIFIISVPFTGIYYIFRKRKKLFLYYFLATFPQQLLLLVGAGIIMAMLLPFKAGTLR